MSATAAVRGAAAGAGVLVASGRAQLGVQLSSPVALVLGVVQPAAFLLVTAWGAGDPAPERLTRTAVAAGLTALWSGTVWSSGGILRREIATGTFTQILCSARDPRLVLLGKSLAASLWTAVAITATSICVPLLLGYRLVLHRPGWFLLGALLAVASAAALGLALSCVFVLTRAAHRISEILLYPVFLLGGLLIPLTLLPVWLRWPSGLVSLRWAQEVLAAAAAGEPVRPGPLVAIGVLTAAYGAVGGWAFGRVLDRGRRKGTLEYR